MRQFLRTLRIRFLPANSIGQSRLAMSVAFLTALTLGHAIGSIVASADHGGNFPETCGFDGQYYHVHWYRGTGDPERDLWYRYFLADTNGSSDYPAAITSEAGWWINPPYAPPYQDFLYLHNDQVTFEYDIRLDVNQFAWSELGRATLDPDACTYPYNDTSTHAKGYVDGSWAAVELNSAKIEGHSDSYYRRLWTAGHELGHVLGLGHRDSSPGDRIMYWQWSGPSTNAYQPRDDDISMMSSQFDPYGHIH